MFDRKTFVRPTAHRGLHNAAQGVIENTWPAFEAAINSGVGIECDVQSSKDNVPLVYHDTTLDRLIEGSGEVAKLNYSALKALTYKNQTETILTFESLLHRVEGRVPLLAELKSDWQAPNVSWLRTICQQVQSHSGPVALMSFDPDLLQTVRALAPAIPIGLVSGRFRHTGRAPWWPDVITEERATALTNLADLDTLKPDFIAYHVKDLDCAAVHHARHGLGLPVFTWTVRSDEDWEYCRTFADAAIFEGPIQR